MVIYCPALRWNVAKANPIYSSSLICGCSRRIYEPSKTSAADLGVLVLKVKVEDNQGGRLQD